MAIKIMPLQSVVFTAPRYNYVVIKNIRGVNIVLWRLCCEINSYLQRDDIY